MQSLKSLIGFQLETADGPAGKLTDFLIHEATWTVGYAVVPAGSMLSGKQWLVPIEETKAALDDRCLKTSRTPADLDALTPRDLTTRSQEGWETLRDGKTPNTGVTAIDEPSSPWRSFNELLGSNIEAPDGGFGMVDDALLLFPEWAIQYLVGRSYDWKRKPAVLIPIAWVKQVSWSGDTIDVTASLASLEKNDPSFKASSHG